MTDQAELNCLVVQNLADLESAAHQVEDVIEPMLVAELQRVFDEFLAKQRWGGELDGLDTLWVAPPEWADPDGNAGDYLCHFGLDVVPLADAEKDYFWLSILTGAALAKAGLYWSSDGISDSKLGKLVANQPAVVERLQQAGFVYDVANKRSLYLPISLDREALLAGMREDSLDDAVEPFATALNAAAAAAPLFKPLFDAIAAEQ